MSTLVLIGEAPTRPGAEPLDPHPGSAAARLATMLWPELAASEAAARLVEVFVRVNLVPHEVVGRWPADRAADAARNLVPLLEGIDTVCLGVRVRSALVRAGWTVPTEPYRWADPTRLHAAWVYHPSGKCRAYNDPAERARLREFLLGGLT